MLPLVVADDICPIFTHSVRLVGIYNNFTIFNRMYSVPNGLQLDRLAAPTSSLYTHLWAFSLYVSTDSRLAFRTPIKIDCCWAFSSYINIDPCWAFSLPMKIDCRLAFRSSLFTPQFLNSSLQIRVPFTNFLETPTFTLCFISIRGFLDLQLFKRETPAYPQRPPSITCPERERERK